MARSRCLNEAAGQLPPGFSSVFFASFILRQNLPKDSSLKLQDYIFSSLTTLWKECASFQIILEESRNDWLWMDWFGHEPESGWHALPCSPVGARLLPPTPYPLPHGLRVEKEWLTKKEWGVVTSRMKEGSLAGQTPGIHSQMTTGNRLSTEARTVRSVRYQGVSFRQGSPALLGTSPP